MQLKEVLAESGAQQDEKARRVRNVSRKLATITADEIESGVSLERLQDIGVPVLTYSTQITIHGRLPAFDESARPGGYKAIVRNGNGSVGVRYCAIDAEKKERVVDASRYADKANRQWHASLRSDGLTVWVFVEQKEECLRLYKFFPKHLIHGSVQATAGLYGGYYVIAYVGAIPAQNLWAFTELLWCIGSQAELDGKIRAAQAEAEQRAMQQREMLANREQAIKAKRAALAATVTLPKLSAMIEGQGEVVRVVDSMLRGVVLMRYVVQRRGACLCYGATAYPSDAQPQKWRKFDRFAMARFQADAEAGMLFTLS